tara:strand:+ start:591 stop:923 length:333 start_codon:yes stop_codon:yes gene_type:complete
MQINYVGVLILLWIVSTAWIVSGYAAKGYKAKNNITMDFELYKHIRKVIDYSYDMERKHYTETFGLESNNYLDIDSDLELHVEQEAPNHIFVSLHYLDKRLVPGDTQPLA